MQVMHHNRKENRMGFFSWIKRKAAQVKSFVTKSYKTAAAFVSKKYNEASSFLKSTFSTASSWVKGGTRGSIKLTSSTLSSAASWVKGKISTASKWTKNTVSTASGWLKKKYSTASTWAVNTYNEGKEYFNGVKNILTGAKAVAQKNSSSGLTSAPANGQSLAYRDYSKLAASSTGASVSGDKEKKTQLLAS